MRLGSRPIGSHANTAQSHVKTRANTAQEFLNLLEAMQIPLAVPRENMCKYYAEPYENA